MDRWVRKAHQASAHPAKARGDRWFIIQQGATPAGSQACSLRFVSGLRRVFTTRALSRCLRCYLMDGSKWMEHCHCLIMGEDKKPPRAGGVSGGHPELAQNCTLARVSLSELLQPDLLLVSNPSCLSSRGKTPVSESSRCPGKAAAWSSLLCQDPREDHAESQGTPEAAGHRLGSKQAAQFQGG